MSTRRVPAGFTLIETIIFIVVVGIAMVGILGVMNFVSSRSADPVPRKQAQLIAESLLEEVQLAGITYCDPNTPNYDTATSSANCATVGATAEGWGQEAGGSARPYDNVNDYVSVADEAQAAFDSGGKLVDANGIEIGAGAYTATLTVTPVALGDIPIGSGADSDAFQIKVTVEYGDGSVTLIGYRTRYAPRS